MKKRLLSILLLTAICILSLSGCGFLFGEVAEEGDVSVVVEEADGSFSKFEVYLESVENKSEGAKGILEHLDGRNDRLYVEMTDGGYGAYVTAIGNLREDSSRGLYVIVYTSVKADSYEGAPTIEYDGVALYQAGLGLSGMTVEAGTVILFRLEESPY